jgi:hypothetical protein
MNCLIYGIGEKKGFMVVRGEIGQFHVNSKIKLTFTQGIHSIVRQDPDIILADEIGDRETAEIAIITQRLMRASSIRKSRKPIPPDDESLANLEVDKKQMEKALPLQEERLLGLHEQQLPRPEGDF